MRLIDGDALEKLLEKLWNVHDDQDFANKDVWREIENAPTVERERKKGQWSNYKDEHCCSVCKCVVISDCWDDEMRYDYCPYCGAEMSEENNNE